MRRSRVIALLAAPRSERVARWAVAAIPGSDHVIHACYVQLPRRPGCSHRPASGHRSIDLDPAAVRDQLLPHRRGLALLEPDRPARHPRRTRAPGTAGRPARTSSAPQALAVLELRRDLPQARRRRRRVHRTRATRARSSSSPLYTFETPGSPSTPAAREGGRRQDFHLRQEDRQDLAEPLPGQRPRASTSRRPRSW